MTDETKITDLKEFITRAKQIIKGFEDALGWQEPDKDVNTNFKICPHNQGHRIPSERYESHVQRCKWRNLGYTNSEVDEIISDETSHFCGRRIFIDDIVAQVAHGMHPLRTHEKYVSTLTREERLQIYDEVIAQINQNEQKVVDPFLYKDLNEKLQQSSDGGEKSNIEVIKAIRDHKRRRQSYRAKNVHVTKRSQTEILREILAIHMDELHQRWNPKSSSRSPSPERDSRPKERVSCENTRDDRYHEDIHEISRKRDGVRERSRENPREKLREKHSADAMTRETSHGRERSFMDDRRFQLRERFHERTSPYVDDRDSKRYHETTQRRDSNSRSPDRYAEQYASSSRKYKDSKNEKSSFGHHERRDRDKREKSYDKHSRRERKHKKHSRKRERDEEDYHKRKKHKKKSSE